MKIKPETKWVAVRPNGTMILEHLSDFKSAVTGGLADSAKIWREMEAEGWRVVEVCIVLKSDFEDPASWVAVEDRRAG